MVRFRALVSVTDTSGGLIAINSYDEYGIPGSGNIGRFQYSEHRSHAGGMAISAGQAWLPELGMMPETRTVWGDGPFPTYYKNRIYSPTLGRFLQTDPIDVAGGINL